MAGVAAEWMLAADRVLMPAGPIGPGWVSVDGDRLTGWGEGRPDPGPGVVLVDVGAALLAPGFVDQHQHGGAGGSYDSGDPDQARRAVAFHRSHGTTSSVASLVSAERGALRRQVSGLAPLVDDGMLLGLHLEGPWISPQHRGAHDPRTLRDPDPGEIDDLLALANGRIAMVTMAPELPGGLAAVRQWVDAGVVVAVGHSDASYDQACAAFDAGATVATHLFNAMTPLRHRHPGVVGAALDHPGVVVELIADLVHVHPAAMRLAARAVGTDRLALVTDAMAAAGVGDGSYRLGSLDVVVRDGVARLVDGGAIAGSTLTLDRALRHAVGAVGLDLVDAVRTVTSTPARVLGREDLVGLRPGAFADVAILGFDGGLTGVLCRGEWVIRPEAVVADTSS